MIGRTLLRGTIFLLAGLFLASPAEGQLRVIPQLGLYAPTSDLGELRDDAGGTLLELGRQSSTLALGLAVELGLETSGLGWRVGASYATASTVPVVGPDCPECAARATLLAAGGAAVIRPLPPMMVAHPYLLVGGGVVRYGFSDEDLREEGWRNVLRNQTRPQLHVGIGTSLSLGAFEPRIELSAHVADFEPGEGPEGTAHADDERQTELFFTIGLPFGR